jgi:murein DD-endopeptidase MepM/ murein hydrolase activator NlpD
MNWRRKSVRPWKRAAAFNKRVPSVLMKQVLNLLLSIILVSCATTGATETPVVVNTKIIATKTISPSPTAVASVTPTITPTLQPPCDPFNVEFCITEGHFVLQRPIQPPGNDLIDPTYGYGSTANGMREPHHGVEFENPSGTPVYTAADGTVIFAGPDEEAAYAPWGNFYGNLVVVAHENDLFTLYAHLSKIDVQEGQKISLGEKIGEVGRTGGAIGSHLHFEVRRRDVEDYFSTQNPELWLIPARDENGDLLGALMISIVDGDGNLVKNANLTVGYYSDPAQSPIKIYYATSYSLFPGSLARR